MTADEIVAFSKRKELGLPDEDEAAKIILDLVERGNFLVHRQSANAEALNVLASEKLIWTARAYLQAATSLMMAHPGLYDRLVEHPEMMRLRKAVRMVGG